MHMANKTTTKNITTTLAFYLSSHVALEFISILMTQKCTSNLKTFDQDKNNTVLIWAYSFIKLINVGLRNSI